MECRPSLTLPRMRGRGREGGMRGQPVPDYGPRSAALHPGYAPVKQHGLPEPASRQPMPHAPTTECQTASLSSLAARNATFRLALILIGSPVAGLRPMRAARLRTTRMPSPPIRMRSPFLRCFAIMSMKSPRKPSVFFFAISFWAARPAARCLSVTVGCEAFAMEVPPVGTRELPVTYVILAALDHEHLQKRPIFVANLRGQLRKSGISSGFPHLPVGESRNFP